MKEFIGEIIANRNLLRQLVIKELKVRYSRPLFGFVWAFLSPVCMVAVFYVIFSLFLKVRIEEAPFVLYLMTAIFPWRFFQDTVTTSTTSFLDNKNLIRESNFPHYLIPVAIALANCVNLLPSLAIVIVVSLFVMKGLPVFILFLPAILSVHLLMATGLSIIFAVLYVRWRDIKYVLEPLLMFLFYLIPGVYSLGMVRQVLPPAAFTAYMSNPLTGITCLYRVALLKGSLPVIRGAAGLTALVCVPVVFAAGILMLGLYVYAKNRYRINDHLSY